MQKRKQKNKIVQIVEWCIFTPLICFLLFFVIVRVFWPQEAINVLGFNFYLVEDTKSMEPYLKKNDLVVIKKTNFDDILFGDDIMFERAMVVEGKVHVFYVTHRVVGVVLDDNGKVVGYKTRGVNSAVGIDERLVGRQATDGSNKFIGKLTFKSSVLGAIVAFCSSKAGIVCLFVNTLCIIGAAIVLKPPKKRQEETVQVQENKTTEVGVSAVALQESVIENAATVSKVSAPPVQMANLLNTATETKMNALVVAIQDICTVAAQTALQEIGASLMSAQEVGVFTSAMAVTGRSSQELTQNVDVSKQEANALTQGENESTAVKGQDANVEMTTQQAGDVQKKLQEAESLATVHVDETQEVDILTVSDHGIIAKTTALQDFQQSVEVVLSEIQQNSNSQSINTLLQGNLANAVSNEQLKTCGSDEKGSLFWDPLEQRTAWEFLDGERSEDWLKTKF